jgi:hypothetical protein
MRSHIHGISPGGAAYNELENNGMSVLRRAGVDWKKR